MGQPPAQLEVQKTKPPAKTPEPGPRNVSSKVDKKPESSTEKYTEPECTIPESLPNPPNQESLDPAKKVKTKPEYELVKDSD